jgi:hypothetical protein
MNKKEKVQNILKSGRLSQINHLKKNNLSYLIDESVHGDCCDIEKNRFDNKKDAPYDSVIELESIDEIASFLKSKNKIKWLKDKGYHNVTI